MITKGIGTIRWSWTGEEGKLHTNKLKNVLYFPDSPVNILTTTASDESIKDDEGAWVPTKRKYYIFNWGCRKNNNSFRKFLSELEI